MKRLNVIYSSDEKYAPYMGVSIFSLLYNNKDQCFNIYIIDGGISQKDRDLILGMENDYDCQILFIKPNRKLFEGVYISGHITEAAYYRLIISELVPKDLDRILYIDCDVIVSSKISELYSENLNDKVLGAVYDPGIDNTKYLGINNPLDYFNDGIMLIDLNKWRKEDITNKSFVVMKNNFSIIKLHDQDVLNLLFKGNYKHLHPKYNAQVQFFKKKRIDGIPDELIRETKNGPVLVHFNTAYKPWHVICAHPKRKMYLKYQRLSPWKDLKIEWPGTIHLSKQFYGFFVPHKAKVLLKTFLWKPLGIRK